MTQVPPHDLDAEAAVISAVLLKPDTFDVLAPVLRAEQFYSPANRRIWEAFVALSAADKPVDMLTVQSWLATRKQLQAVGGSKYLAEILDKVPAAFNVEAYAAIVSGKWRMRQVISAAQEIAAEGYTSGDDPQVFCDSAEQRIYDLARVEQSSTLQHIKGVMHSAFTAIHGAHQRGEGLLGQRTGFTRLDKLTGGMRGGDLIIVAGRPGMGKSAFAMNVAVNAAASRTAPATGVAVFSLEMPREQLAVRMACSDARVDLARMRDGALQQADWSHLTASSGHLSRLPLWIDDASDVSLLELRAKVRRLRAMAPQFGARLGLVVIDYLQLMSGNPKARSREQQIAEISRGLKKLAKDLDVPVMALSQLNRSVETRGSKDKRPQLSDLRESGAIEQDADMVLFVHRQEYYEPENNEVRGLAELIVAKQRNGPTGRIRVRFNKACTRFDDLADEYYANDEPEERGW